MPKSKKLTIRFEPDTLEFIDQLRRKNSNGGNYASRSETVRRIINDWRFRMLQPLSPEIGNLVIDEDALAEKLEDRGYEIVEAPEQD